PWPASLTGNRCPKLCPDCGSRLCQVNSKVVVANDPGRVQVERDLVPNLADEDGRDASPVGQPQTVEHQGVVPGNVRHHTTGPTDGDPQSGQRVEPSRLRGGSVTLTPPATSLVNSRL